MGTGTLARELAPAVPEPFMRHAASREVTTAAAASESARLSPFLPRRS